MYLKVCVFVTLLLILLSTANSTRTYFISSPNVIRVGVNETIVVNVFGSSLGGNEVVPVTVKLQDYPARTKTFDTETVNVKKDRPVTVTLRVEDVAENDVSNQGPQYVYLHAQSQLASFPIDEGMRVLLSYKAGYTFIQTDKPIYTPNQEVFIRLVTVDQQMRPSKEKVRVDIKTPQNVVVHRFDDVTPVSGFVNDLMYRFPQTPAFGNWTVVAYYGPTLRHNTTVQFLVKEYVLPTFSVNVEVPEPNQTPSQKQYMLLKHRFILSSRQSISVLVRGTYVFGEVVRGSYRIKYSLLNEDGSLDFIKDVNGQLTEHGEGSNAISMPEILRGQEFDDLIGKRLHIEAFVVEGATGKVESTNYTKLMFVDSPFRFKWDQTLKYFRVKIPFHVKMNVEDLYGDPVSNLPVRAIATGYNANTIARNLADATVQSNDLGEVKVALNIPHDIQRIDVNVETVAIGDLANFQQIDEFQLQQFNGQGYNQLQIQAPTKIQAKTVSIPIELKRNNVNPEAVDNVHIFTYVVAGGKIVETSAQRINGASTVTNINITQEMVPSARIVSFYVNDDNQVIADTLWVDVEDTCQNNVSIAVPATNKHGHNFFEPGETIKLTLKAEPQTKIGLLAVDSAVYLLQDYHRLTKKKMFARMASYDLGCGPGGGSDTQDIFKNAGISVITNAALATERRQDLSCADHNRKRRSVAGADYDIFELEAEYEGNETLIDYCNRGKQVMSWSCLQRTDRQKKRNGLDDDHPYIQAFYRCCLAMEQASGRSSAGPGPASRVIKDEDYRKVSIRSDFRESWLFNSLVDMGDSTSISHDIGLPSSITTWVLQAVGVSPLHGMCVADNKEIVARREVFLDVAIPYSVMRQEQVAIVATVYNYHHRDQPVTVQMEGQEGLCSNAAPGEFETFTATIPPGRAHSFTFIVVPLEVEDFLIVFYMFSNQQDDAVRKTLHVIPEGLPIVKSKSILLDPENIEQQLPQGTVRLATQAAILDPGQAADIEHEPQVTQNDGVNSIQTDVVTVHVPDNAVPDTARCDISLIGSLLGPVLDVAIQGLDVEKFLQYPTHCGEQTMIKMAPNVYILEYLKSTDQLTEEIKTKASEHIKVGYSREVNEFRTDEGAFKTFDHTPGNSWLTAFVLRVFCHAQNFSFIDDKVICSGMKWLSDRQKGDGSFDFTFKTWHQSHFMGGVTEPVPLTAFVLIALTECDCGTMDTTATGAKATMFLENKLQEISQDAHTLAITTYALALVKSSRVNDFNTQLRTHAIDANLGHGSLYFPQSSSPLTVETTAYALLAQVQLGEMAYARNIVQWLLTQRDQIGLWRSTQDTMVALQALTQYASKESASNIDMTCEATSTNANFEQNWVVDTENALHLQTVQNDVPVPLGELTFMSSGSGIATLSVKLHYNLDSGDADLCPFSLTVDTINKKPDPLPGGNNDNDKPKAKIAITICTKYLGEGQTNMGIIEVGMLSGFSPITENLNKIIEDTEIVRKYDVSDRSAILYLDNIPGGEGVEPICLTVEAQQDFEVSNVQPATVKVYDFYISDKKCTKFYRPGEGSPLLEKLCTGKVCECAAARCVNMTAADHADASDLLDGICRSNHQGFAYKVTVRGMETKDTFEVYTTEVRSPLKTGLDENVLPGQERLFLKSINCDDPVLKVDNDYLIVGKGGIPKKDGNGYRYLISSSYTIKHWPRSNPEDESKSQYREPEKKCKSACNDNDKNCKVGCRKAYRPKEEKLRAFFDEVISVFGKGCQQ